jgi:hypothetical protein
MRWHDWGTLIMLAITIGENARQIVKEVRRG